MDIIYNPQMQENNRIIIESYLQKYLWLIPKWCHKLNVGLWDGDGKTLASMQSEYTYRRCNLEVYSMWLDRTPSEQEKVILHELIHCHLAVIADYARNTINNIVSTDEAPKFNQHLQEQLEIYHESVTEDLVFAISNYERRKSN